MQISVKRLIRLWDFRRLLSACGLNSALLISLPLSCQKGASCLSVYCETGAQLHSFWDFNGDWKKFAPFLFALDSLPPCLSRSRGGVATLPQNHLLVRPEAISRRQAWEAFLKQLILFLTPRLGISSPLQQNHQTFIVNPLDWLLQCFLIFCIFAFICLANALPSSAAVSWDGNPSCRFLKST